MSSVLHTELNNIFLRPKNGISIVNSLSPRPTGCCNQSMGTAPSHHRAIGMPHPQTGQGRECRCHHLNHNAWTHRHNGTKAPTARLHSWVVPS